MVATLLEVPERYGQVLLPRPAVVDDCQLLSSSCHSVWQRLYLPTHTHVLCVCEIAAHCILSAD